MKLNNEQFNILRKISKLHPIFDDGMRLYISLAMFAIFEDDKMRVNNGFLPIFFRILQI
mgnify:CR=1 FL=1